VRLGAVREGEPHVQHYGQQIDTHQRNHSVMVRVAVAVCGGGWGAAQQRVLVTWFALTDGRQLPPNRPAKACRSGSSTPSPHSARPSAHLSKNAHQNARVTKRAQRVQDEPPAPSSPAGGGWSVSSTCPSSLVSHTVADLPAADEASSAAGSGGSDDEVAAAGCCCVAAVLWCWCFLRRCFALVPVACGAVVDACCVWFAPAAPSWLCKPPPVPFVILKSVTDGFRGVVVMRGRC